MRRTEFRALGGSRVYKGAIWGQQIGNPGLGLTNLTRADAVRYDRLKPVNLTFQDGSHPHIHIHMESKMGDEYTDASHGPTGAKAFGSNAQATSTGDVTLSPGFPICLPQMAPLYTREPPSARNSVRRTIVQLQRPSPQPTLTWNRPEPLLSGHFSDTAPHLCPFFASLRCTRPRVSLPAPAAPRSSAASRRRAAGSDDLPPAGASSIWRASPAGLRFSPAAAGDSSATSA